MHVVAGGQRKAEGVTSCAVSGTGVRFPQDTRTPSRASRVGGRCERQHHGRVEGAISTGRVLGLGVFSRASCLATDFGYQQVWEGARHAARRKSNSRVSFHLDSKCRKP